MMESANDGARIGGISELINEERGRTFETFSANSLAEVLTEFDEMPVDDLEQMGRSARTYVMAVHSRQSYLDKCRSVYETML